MPVLFSTVTITFVLSTETLFTVSPSAIYGSFVTITTPFFSSASPSVFMPAGTGNAGIVSVFFAPQSAQTNFFSPSLPGSADFVTVPSSQLCGAVSTILRSLKHTRWCSFSFSSLQLPKTRSVDEVGFSVTVGSSDGSSAAASFSGSSLLAMRSARRASFAATFPSPSMSASQAPGCR